MPRLTPSLFRKAHSISPLLPKLLPACRDIPSARNELRWIREHAAAATTTGSSPSSSSTLRRRRHVASMCERRRRGVPLQYILGTQPFGHLDIKCAPGVLIPRPETEAYTVHLANLIKQGRILTGMTNKTKRHSLNVIDFCTGTGCIPLLLYSMLAKQSQEVHVAGVDISPGAVALAEENLRLGIEAGHVPAPNCDRFIAFYQGDVFDREWVECYLARTATNQEWDVMVSNPPYVSNDAWRFGRGELSFSARKYEPELALVPGRDVPRPAGWRREDAFYAGLLDVAGILRPKVLLLEVGDERQACRILPLLMQHPFARNATCEIWRDNPDVEGDAAVPEVIHIESAAGEALTFPVRGSGNVRSILVQRDGLGRQEVVS